MARAAHTGLIILTLLLVGCSAWEKVGGPYEAHDDGFQVEFPTEWNKSGRVKERHLITRDGTLLQLIEVARVSLDKALPHTKRKLDKSMTPLEASEVIADDIRSNQNILNAQILENLPATVSGLPGFKLVYSCNTKEGLKKMGVFYGVVKSSHIYFLHYYAPARHYFQKDLDIFERVKESFKIKA